MRSSLKLSDIKAFLNEHDAEKGVWLFLSIDPPYIATLRDFDQKLTANKTDRELSAKELIDLAKVAMKVNHGPKVYAKKVYDLAKKITVTGNPEQYSKELFVLARIIESCHFLPPIPFENHLYTAAVKATNHTEIGRTPPSESFFNFAKAIMAEARPKLGSIEEKFYTKISSRLPMTLAHSASVDQLERSNLLSLTTVERLIRQYPENAKKIADGLLVILKMLGISKINNESLYLALNDIQQDEINNYANVEDLCNALDYMHQLNILTPENRTLLLTANLNGMKTVSACLFEIINWVTKPIDSYSTEQKNIIFRSIITFSNYYRENPDTEQENIFFRSSFTYSNHYLELSRYEPRNFVCNISNYFALFDTTKSQQESYIETFRLFCEITTKRHRNSSNEINALMRQLRIDRNDPSKINPFLTKINDYATSGSIPLLTEMVQHMPNFSEEKLALFLSNPAATESIHRIIHGNSIENKVSLNAVYHQLHNDAKEVKKLTEEIKAKHNSKLTQEEFLEIIRPYQLLIPKRRALIGDIILIATGLIPELGNIVKEYYLQPIFDMYEIEDVTPANATDTTEHSTSSRVSLDNIDMKDNRQGNAAVTVETTPTASASSLGLFNNVAPIQLNDPAPTDVKEAIAAAESNATAASAPLSSAEKELERKRKSDLLYMELM